MESSLGCLLELAAESWQCLPPDRSTEVSDGSRAPHPRFYHTAGGCPSLVPQATSLPAAEIQEIPPFGPCRNRSSVPIDGIGRQPLTDRFLDVCLPGYQTRVPKPINAGFSIPEGVDSRGNLPYRFNLRRTERREFR